MKSLSLALAALLSSLAVNAATLRVPAGADFATQVLNNPWDYSDSKDIYPLLWTHNLSAAKVDNGILTATARDTDPHFWTLFPQVASSTATLDRPQVFIDANRYTQLSFYMWLPDTVIPGAKNGRITWHFGGYTVAEFDANYAESQLFPVYPGWRQYTFDLKTLTPRVGKPWAGQVAGLRIDPALATQADFKLDWVRITDPTNTASRLKDTRLDTPVLWVDTDTDSSNGAIRTLPRQTDGSFAFDSLMPGDYRVAAISDEEYALSQRGKAWSISTIGDFNWASRSGFTGEGVSNGQFVGTTNSADPYLLMDIPDDKPIDASKYRYLRVKMTLDKIPAQESGLLIFWGTQAASFSFNSEFMPVSSGSKEYLIDLGTSANWKGSIKALRIDPVNGPNAGSSVKVTIDHVSLSSKSTAPSDTVTYLADTVTVNTPPAMTLLSPSLASGNDYAQSVLGRQWDMTDSFSVKNPQELLNADFVGSVPELGLVGSFFRGVSKVAPAGRSEGDAAFHLIFQENDKPIDSSLFSLLQVRMYTPFNEADSNELLTGAIARIAWKEDDFDSGLTTDDILLLPGMHDYWVDLPNMRIEPANTRRWANKVRYLRIDPHEYLTSRMFYVDQASLRALPTAFNKLNIAVSLASTGNSKFTLVALVDGVERGRRADLAAGPQGLDVDISGLSAGSHTLNICADDGNNQTCVNAPTPFIRTTSASLVSLPDADSLFDWAQATFASLLQANGEKSVQVGDFYARCYARSGKCVGVFDGNTYFYDGASVLNLGGSAPFIAQAKAGGF